MSSRIYMVSIIILVLAMAVIAITGMIIVQSDLQHPVDITHALERLSTHALPFDVNDQCHVYKIPETIVNTFLKTNETFVLYLNYPNFLHLSLSRVKSDGFFTNNAFNHKDHLFPTYTIYEPLLHDSAAYLIINSIVPNYRVYYSNVATFHRFENRILVFLTFSLGIMFAMLMGNLALGLFLKDKSFLLHSLYLCPAMIYQYYSMGISKSITGVQTYVYYFWGLVSYFMMIFFLYHYLDIKKHFPKIKHIFRALMMFLIAIMPFALGEYRDWVYLILSGLGVILPLLAFFLFCFMKHKRLNISHYFIVGSVLLGTTILVMILSQYGTLKSRWLWHYAFSYALSLEALFFSLGIFDQLKELREKTHFYYEIAIKDSLTKIHNRHYLDIYSRQLFENARRRNEELSFLILDIDKFKSVNDAFGHDVGDIVLKDLASLIKSRLRKSDFFIRWGGEEFVILLPNTSLNNAQIIANKLRKCVKEKAFKDVGSISISIGIAKWDGESIDDLYKKADLALYEAKAQNGNVVIVYNTT